MSGEDDPEASTVHALNGRPNTIKYAERGSICEYLRNTDVISDLSEYFTEETSMPL